jgi:hypothetical protein
MTEPQIEQLIRQILQRLQSPSLLLVTASDGYRQEVFSRLQQCGERFCVLVAKDVADGLPWHSLGETLPADGALPAFRTVIVPFLDYPLAANIVNGNVADTIAQRLHEALLAGLPVLALRYECCPDSELNQLRGLQRNAAYCQHIQATLDTLTACGVSLCTFNELAEKLCGTTPAVPDALPRYLTLGDVTANPTLAAAAGAKLTDAAREFLKNNKS